MIECSLCSSTSLTQMSCKDHKIYWHCLHCDLIALDPKFFLSEADEQKRYRFHTNSLEDSSYMEYMGEFVEAVLPVYSRTKGVALDFGAGPVSAISEIVGSRLDKVVSYDPLFFSQELLENQKFDLVFCSEVVEHFKKPTAEFEFLDTLLRGKSAVIAIRTQPHTLLERFCDWSYRRDPTHACFYSDKTFTHLAARHGWALKLQVDSLWVFEKN